MTIEEAAEILEEIKHIIPPEYTDSTLDTLSNNEGRE